MVSSIDSMRLWSQQAALKAFKEVDQGTTSNSSTSDGSSMSLADYFYSQDNADDDGEDSKLSALIASLQQQAMTGGATETDTEDDGSVDDMSSKAFMKAVQDKIDALKNSPDTAAMAETMQEALDSGNLTITDVVAGQQITGWNVADDGTPTTPTDTDISDWSSYLKQHLLRDDNGRYVRNGDSSHQDKTTGASSYFGMIGETYYYLSWTKAVTTTASSSTTTK
jgi:hypothetical protein